MTTCCRVLPLAIGVLLVAGSGCRGPEASPPAPPADLELPTRFPAVRRTVAVGDLHGDLGTARSALRLAGAIDEDDRWIGGDLVVVQLGDVLDRGDDELEILELFESLTEQALAAGGAVHLLNGNHELMNARLDFRYVTVGGFLDFLPTDAFDASDPSNEAVLEGLRERTLAMRPGGEIALDFAARNVVAVVGDTVFAHGGVLPHVARYGLERLNQETRQWLRREVQCPPEVLLPSDGPVWSRHFSDAPDDDDCRLLGETLELVSASRMVVGHTVMHAGIAPACDGRVWRIDVGMAEHYGGSPAVLELTRHGPRVLTAGVGRPPRPRTGARSDDSDDLC